VFPFAQNAFLSPLPSYYRSLDLGEAKQAVATDRIRTGAFPLPLDHVTNRKRLAITAVVYDTRRLTFTKSC
jgi:hypothetical protein